MTSAPARSRTLRTSCSPRHTIEMPESPRDCKVCEECPSCAATDRRGSVAAVLPSFVRARAGISTNSMPPGRVPSPCGEGRPRRPPDLVDVGAPGETARSRRSRRDRTSPRASDGRCLFLGPPLDETTGPAWSSPRRSTSPSGSVPPGQNSAGPFPRPSPPHVRSVVRGRSTGLRRGPSDLFDRRRRDSRPPTATHRPSSEYPPVRVAGTECLPDLPVNAMGHAQIVARSRWCLARHLVRAGPGP